MSGAEVDHLQDPAKVAARRFRAAQERVRALLGPDPAEPEAYWRALADPATDWSAWAPPAAERAVIPDWRQAA